jgi:hypothetical protein
MRTTLDIADDVLFAAKALGKKQHKTAGQVLSELARMGLNMPNQVAEPKQTEEFLGFRPLASRGVIVTNELIEQLREEEAI